MTLGHWVEVCRHGFIVRQCRCLGEKDVRLVTCPDEVDCFRRVNHMELPDEATIVTETGVFYERYDEPRE